MKKFNIILFFLMLYSWSIKGQEIYDRRGQSIYFELGGMGCTYSVNYDARFKEKTDGFGGRAGFAYSYDSWTIPVGVNYLLGKEGADKFLELGVGASYISYFDPIIKDGKSSNNQLVGSIAIMYRKQPRFKKSIFRAGLIPLFGYVQSESFTVFPMPTLSWGVSF